MNNKALLTITAIAICCTAILTACNSDNKTNNQIDPVAPHESAIVTEPEKAHFIIKDTPATKATKTTYTHEGELVNSLEIEELSITQHERIDKDAASKMRDVLITQGEKRLVSIYDGSIKALFAAMDSENFDANSLPYKMTVDYSCIRNDGRAISLVETITSYSAGTPLNTLNSTYNFVPLTGERISQPFYTPGNSDEFNAADNTMYEKLVAKYGTDVINYDNVAASFVDLAASCWHFTADGKGVTVLFAPGRIAPEESGALEIDYTKEELPEFAQKYFN